MKKRYAMFAMLLFGGCGWLVFLAWQAGGPREDVAGLVLVAVKKVALKQGVSHDGVEEWFAVHHVEFDTAGWHFVVQVSEPPAAADRVSWGLLLSLGDPDDAVPLWVSAWPTSSMARFGHMIRDPYHGVAPARKKAKLRVAWTDTPAVPADLKTRVVNVAD